MKEIPVIHPGSVAFEIIESCNFYCHFCVRNAHSRLTGRLTIDTFRQRLETVSNAFGKLNLVALTGGEPLLHPDLVQLAAAGMEYARHISITTNASIVDFDLLRALAELQCLYFILSLDGPTPEVHDQARGFPGAFDLLKQFTCAARETSLRLLVNITVGEWNKSSVYETIAKAVELGATDISVALVKPHGRGLTTDADEVTLTETARQVMLAQRTFGHAVRLRFTEPLAHLFDVSIYASERSRGCGAASGTLHIQYNGTVLLCTSCKESLGNIDLLGEQIADQLLMDQRLAVISERSKLGGACGDCEVVSFCGGCRCRAGTAGDFLGGDPLCPKNRHDVMPSELDRCLAEVERRLEPAAAHDPDGFRSWLSNFEARQRFSRTDPDFHAQLRWGHDHPLGGGKYLFGEMGRRHIEVLREFLRAGALPMNLCGWRILDVGPWTGGESLVLAALGAKVDAVEEHEVYADTITYLASALELPVRVIGGSLYDLASEQSHGYDAVYLSGVVSHLSDPFVGLRITFHHLRDGGRLLLETQTSYLANGGDEFWGPSRPGWVWWNLSRPALLELLHAAGFERTRVVHFGKHRRWQLVAERSQWKPIADRVGLSHPALP